MKVTAKYEKYEGDKKTVEKGEKADGRRWLNRRQS